MTPAKFLLGRWAEIQKFNPYLKIELSDLRGKKVFADADETG